LTITFANWAEPSLLRKRWNFGGAFGVLSKRIKKKSGRGEREEEREKERDSNQKV